MSTRGTRTVYRETDVERDTEPRSSYTTIKRYKVPESIARSVYDDNDETVDKKIVIKRTERRDSSPSAHSNHTHRTHRTHRTHHHDHYDDTEWKFKETTRETRAPSTHTHREHDDVDIRFTKTTTERERDPSPRRDIRYKVVHRDYSPERERSRSEYKVVERETEVIRAPSPPSPERTQTREWRFERERSYSPPQRERERPYDIERYSKSTEYFQPAPAPQPIIIRESTPQAPVIIREERREAAPIIIREERREPQRIIIKREEPQFEFIEREEVRDETKSLVKSEAPPPAPAPEPEKKPEEDYFYERRVIERRRRSDSYDRKTEIRPRDSASQGYHSDDSYEYVRHETRYESDDDKSSRRRHLAGGALAGIGAAEILRHHRKSQGENVGGQLGTVAGGAALGAVGAEAIKRVRSMSRRRRDSRERSRSGERPHGERRHRRHRSRERSEDRGFSFDNLSGGQKALGGLAAIAAAAAAGYAIKNRNKETVIVNDRIHHRSRSRRRRHSADGYGPDGPEHRDPDHRNRRIAQAGLASAAAAGIFDKVRSRSKGGRDRSKSRIRTGVPIAAAGLGGAALAGLYEKNKANKEAKKEMIIEDEMNRGRHRSRSRSRGHPDMVAYGNEPIESDRGYYSDEEPGRYRRRGGSHSSSPDTRSRSKSRRSRSRGLAGAGALGAAGVGAVAAHEWSKRRDRNRSRDRSRDRSRSHSQSRPGSRRRDDDYYDDRRDDPYSQPMGHQSSYQNNDPYQQGGQQYPQANYFPPPPNADYNQARGNLEPQPEYAHAPYNPAEYANQPATQQPYDQQYGGYGEQYSGNAYARDQRYPHDPHPDDGRRGRDPENVSAPPPSVEEYQQQQQDQQHVPQERGSQDGGDGLRTPRQRSSSRVRFDLESNIAHSPDAARRKDDAKREDPTEQRHSDTETSVDRKHRRRRRDKGKERARDDDEDRDRRHRSDRDDRKRDSTGLMHDKYERGLGEDTDDSVIELPDRFDKHGNPKPEDPLAAKINDLLSGRGGGGDIFKTLAEGFLGVGGAGGSDTHGGAEEEEGRRRRRRSDR